MYFAEHFYKWRATVWAITLWLFSNLSCTESDFVRVLVLKNSMRLYFRKIEAKTDPLDKDVKNLLTQLWWNGIQDLWQSCSLYLPMLSSTRRELAILIDFDSFVPFNVSSDDLIYFQSKLRIFVLTFRSGYMYTYSSNHEAED